MALSQGALGITTFAAASSNVKSPWSLKAETAEPKGTSTRWQCRWQCRWQQVESCWLTGFNAWPFQQISSISCLVIALPEWGGSLQKNGQEFQKCLCSYEDVGDDSVAVRLQARIGGGPAGDALSAKLFNSSKQSNYMCSMKCSSLVML